MIKATISGKVVTITERKYTSEKTGKEYQSWQVLLLNEQDNFSPTMGFSLAYDEGLAMGFPNKIPEYQNKIVELRCPQVRSYQKQLILDFDEIVITK